MKIYGQEPLTSNNEETSLSVTNVGGSLTLSFGKASVTVSPPKTVEIVGVYEGVDPTKLYILLDSERFASRDSVSMAMETKGIGNVASFVALVAVTPKDVYVVTRYPLSKDVTGATYMEAEALAFPREFIKTLDPELRAFVTKSKAKRKLLSGLTPTDSLSALEKQVDLLTMLVLSLARKQPVAEQPAWLDELETVFVDTSSVQEDALEKAVASMGEYKAHIRALQEEYFRNRSTT